MDERIVSSPLIVRIRGFSDVFMACIIVDASLQALVLVQKLLDVAGLHQNSVLCPSFMVNLPFVDSDLSITHGIFASLVCLQTILARLLTITFCLLIVATPTPGTVVSLVPEASKVWNLRTRRSFSSDVCSVAASLL
jgi:hypothetical protein